MPRYSSPSSKTKRRVWERDLYLCAYCGIKCIEWRGDPKPPNAVTVDHIVARSAGGGNAITNLATACFECNQAKGGNHRLHDHSDASKNLAVAYALVNALAKRDGATP